jgi:NAD(P)-dependent dehydrogenase (short-subunit alcohol dehydrogenase family)
MAQHPTDPSTDDRPVALVTGAGRGIGAEAARQLAEAGFHVVVTARRLDDADATAGALRADGFASSAAALDLADPASVAGLGAAFAERPLDVLVNNAAAFADWAETPSTADLAVAASVMETNLFGTWRVIQALLPALRRAPHARIVVVGSGSGSFGEPQFGLAQGPAAVSYAVSKAALHALAVKLGAELAGEGITVHAVDPGLTATAPGMEAMGARPVADGARSVLRPVLDPDTPVGVLTRDGHPLPW